LEQDDLAGWTRALRTHAVTALATREVQLARGARYVHAPDRHTGGRCVHAVHVTRGARAARVRSIARAVPEPLDVALFARAFGLGTSSGHQKLVSRGTGSNTSQLVALNRAVVEVWQ